MTQSARGHPGRRAPDPAVLVRLAAIDVDELTEVITDAWLARANKTLRAAFLAERSG